jgi:hypothetical protein
VNAGDVIELRESPWVPARVTAVYATTNTMQVYVMGSRGHSVPMWREGVDWRRPTPAPRPQRPAPIAALGLDPDMAKIAEEFFA